MLTKYVEIDQVTCIIQHLYSALAVALENSMPLTVAPRQFREGAPQVNTRQVKQIAHERLGAGGEIDGTLFARAF